MEKLFIPVVLGTGRKGRKSEKVARFVVEQAQEYGFETQLIDVRDFATPVTIAVGEGSNKEKQWSETMQRADGLIIVAPEYNHGYPGELKIFLDKLRKEYQRKPVSICAVSAGGLGGARMVEQLRLVAIELQMVPIHNAVYFSKVRELFDEKGKIKEKWYTQRITAVFDELSWYAKALKQAKSKADHE